ncbi:MAG TPA: flagellin [Phycisphaerales bacterium]|nr:flagellin [Phycisphaerales bacterium]
MSRINTNVQSLIAQRTLTQNNFNLGQSLERLSTGLRINRGKDDPAGLIASQRLDSEAKAIGAAISNANRADQVVNIAEGGLNEVSGLLTELQGLVTNTANSAGLSDDEKKANQLQIDSILQTIDRVSGATAFQGKKLLNGTLDYTTSSVAAGVSTYKVNGAKLSNGGTLAVQALVTRSAQNAGLFLSTNGALNLGGTNGSFSVEVAGAQGSRQFTFASGTTAASIVTAINSFKTVTGVSALASGTGLKLASTEFGSSQFVSVKTISTGGITGTGVGIYGLTTTNFATANTGSATTFANATNGVRDAGQDVQATINGITATANGKTARVNTDFLDVELTFTNSVSQTLGSVNALTITGGGADFQLAGNVDIAGKVSLGVGNVAIRNIGGNTNSSGVLEYLNSLGSGQTNNVVTSTDLAQAQKIIGNAITEVSTLRGRLGAFQKNTIGATVRSLGVALENTTAAESSIKDANFAEETASLTRNQILVQAATNVLGLANQAPQQALRLLQ